MYVPLPLYEHSIFIGTRLLACYKQRWFRTNGDKPAFIPSIAYLCPKCGEVWGRRYNRCVEPEHPELEHHFDWRCDIRPCEAHGDGSLVRDEREWQDLLERDSSVHYPIEWLAYELFLVVRRFP